jgi:hypothetical protein
MTIPIGILVSICVALLVYLVRKILQKEDFQE